MQTFSSRDVQTRFGAVMDIAKRDAVTVTQYGRPVVVMMNVEDAQAALRARAGRRLTELLRKLPPTPAAEALTDQDINALVHELR
jgi:prevent-host-death family protein